VPKRVRRRYLAIKFVSEQAFTERAVMNAIWKAILRLFGEYGASQTELNLVEADPQSNYAVVRCSHRYHERTRASIASITEINGKPAVVHVIGVSGTLKALRKKLST
jgi:ribonuclease P/MRP protein subunit POP5